MQDDSCIFFNGDKVLNYTGSFLLPCKEILSEKDSICIGEDHGKKIYAAVYSQEPADEKFSLTPTRDALSLADAKTAQWICRGKHLLHWHCNSLFCGSCGAATHLSSHEIAKICSNCKKLIYPTYSNFVIVLIEKEGKLLLARSPHFAQGVYSAIAGFVDAGETYEDAVHREVQEELGIKVKNLRYFGSQSWPFPSSMAAAFLSEYAEGTIQTDPHEIEDARWFEVDRLPSLPHPCSISRHIIDHCTKKT